MHFGCGFRVFCGDVAVFFARNPRYLWIERMTDALGLDSFDLKLLSELQQDGRLTNAELGERVHLSASQVSRRVQRLIEEGYIERFQAVLSRQKLGLGLTVYCLVTLKIHAGDSMQAFHERVRALPEVMECQSLTGEADYVLKIVVADLKRFSDFMSGHLMKAPEVANIRSSVVLESIKETGAYPLQTKAGR
jgi:Lrp/AsnC family leucine-responsive transcriptional regulator